MEILDNSITTRLFYFIYFCIIPVETKNIHNLSEAWGEASGKVWLFCVGDIISISLFNHSQSKNINTHHKWSIPLFPVEQKLYTTYWGSGGGASGKFLNLLLYKKFPRQFPDEKKNTDFNVFHILNYCNAVSPKLKNLSDGTDLPQRKMVIFFLGGGLEPSSTRIWSMSWAAMVKYLVSLQVSVQLFWMSAYIYKIISS